MKQLRELKIKGSDHALDILIATPIHKGEDPWGAFACLKGTDWEGHIPVLHGEILTHALHGRVLPLLNAIGVAPDVHLRRLKQHTCALYRQCAMADKTCNPNNKVPACYAAPFGSSLDPEKAEKSEAASVVTLAWSKGYYVAVFTQEGEFSFL